ncbi:hypothetical protein M3221_10785 [Domibacillus indicus]|uniref:lipopolysaccharide biosynthesis protein n=1 Tax=Domibacillus indicus TaxID=1437523 RepID=UPI0020414340|nr:hypothetical protein [Domibacillus indicus]MCM3788891.1 hypothetical protein [Domibacillus indicus]
MYAFKSLVVNIKNADVKSIILFKNVVLSFLIRGAAIIVSLFTLPAYMNFFSDQTILGIWFTAISVLSWILTFDLGIGNGLRNYLVEPFMKNDTEEIKKNISSAYILVGLLVIFLSIISMIIIPLLNWNLVFNIPKDKISPDVLQFMTTMLILGILLQFWLKLITSIFYALQKAAMPSFLLLCSSFLMLLFTLYSKTDNIIYNIKSLSIAYALTANIPYLIATLFLFSTLLKKCKPNIYYFKKSYAKRIIKLGGNFFYLQILTMIMFSTNEFFISWLVNPKEVVTYQIYNKLFSILSTFFNLALTPVWSAVTEARIKNDYLWVKRLYHKLNLMLLILVLFEIILIILMPNILNFWLGNNAIEVNSLYCFLFALYNILFIKVGIDTNIIAGLGKLKVQTYALTITTLLKVGLSILLINITGSWITLIIANNIALIPYIVIEFFDIRHRFKLFNKDDIK